MTAWDQGITEIGREYDRLLERFDVLVGDVNNATKRRDFVAAGTAGRGILEISSRLSEMRSSYALILACRDAGKTPFTRVIAESVARLIVRETGFDAGAGEYKGGVQFVAIPFIGELFWSIEDVETWLNHVIQ